MGKANVTKKWSELHADQKSLSVTDNLVEQKELIDNYFFLFDCLNNHILYTNIAFNTITGHDNSNFTIEQLLDIIHPDDLNYFYACEEKGLKFTNQLLFKEHFRYTLSYSYRIRCADKNYVTILQECQAIEVNNSGHLTKTLVNHRKINTYATRPTNDYKIYDRMKGILADIDNHYNLTKRELEIVELVKEGYPADAITDKLCISKHTLRTHRKNILNKTDCGNFMEIIKKLSFNSLH